MTLSPINFSGYHWTVSGVTQYGVRFLIHSHLISKTLIEYFLKLYIPRFTRIPVLRISWTPATRRPHRGCDSYSAHDTKANRICLCSSTMEVSITVPSKISQ